MYKAGDFSMLIGRPSSVNSLFSVLTAVETDFEAFTGEILE